MRKQLKFDQPVYKYDLMWVDKYKPKTISELAIHTKKIEEVAIWCKNMTDNSILLLIGPPGCGKSACVSILPDLIISNWTSGDVNSFNDFVLRTSRYQEIDDESIGNSGKRVILIESLPNQFYEDPSKLHETLTNYKAVAKHPLILILSDSSVMKFSHHSLVPKSLQHKLDIKTISFNPIAITQMKKALVNIMDKESTIKSRSKRSQEIIADIYNKSGGDIRSAINNLQVFMKGPSDPGDELDMNKDVHLFIFRALGKILYAKRQTDEREIENYRTKLATLRPCPPELWRAPLLFSPELLIARVIIAAGYLDSICGGYPDIIQEVFANSGLGHSTFINYLHENYVDFVEDIGHVSTISDFFSYSDHLFDNWSAENVRSGGYDVSLVSRAVAFYNESRSKNTWRPLRKSNLADAAKKTGQLKADVVDLIESGMAVLQPRDIVTLRQALTDKIPACAKIGGRPFASSVFDKLRFSKRHCGVGSALEDNVPVDSVDSPGVAGFTWRKTPLEPLWTVCKYENEENVVIDIGD